MIRGKLQNLSEDYRQLAFGGSMNYKGIKNRFAFVYRYVAAHSYVVYDCIDRSPILRGLFNRRSVHVSCLGGGPGSELIGILQFIKLLRRQPELTCHTYDKEIHWKVVWDCLFDTVYPSLAVSGDYQFRQLDVTDPLKCKKYPDICQTDLFTMVFLLSELQSRKNKNESFLFDVFQCAKPGACFLFVDMCYGDSAEWFDKMVKNYNSQYPLGQLERVGDETEGNDVERRLPDEEQVVDLEPYHQHICQLESSGDKGIPRRTLKIDYRIYCKLSEEKSMIISKRAYSPF